MLARVHLPEMGRDEVARAISEIQLPEFDIRGAFAKLEMPKFEMPHADVRKAMAKAGFTFPAIQTNARRRWLVRRLRGQRTDLVALGIAPEVPSVAAAAVPASRPPTAVAMEEEQILVESGEPC